MILMELKRDTYTEEETVGILTIAGTKFHTVERPWVQDPDGGRGGHPFTSCVAPGVYKVERFERPSGENAFILSNPLLDIYQHPDQFPNDRKAVCRALCLIHAANWAYQLHGCIGPGKSRLKQPQRWMVTESRITMNELRTLVGADLTIQLKIEA